MAQAQTIPASEARNNFSDLISKVEYQHQEFLIERYGEVVAKLVPVTVEGKQTAQDSRQKEEFARAKQEIKKIEVEPKSEQVETPAEQAKTESSPVKTSAEQVGAESAQAKQSTTDNLEQYQPESVLQALQKLSDLSKKQSAEKSEDEVSQQDERVEVIRKRIKLLMDR